MKSLISIVLFVGFTTNTVVKKKRLSYPVIISYADLIVEGTISDVSSFVYEYDFQITEFIKGSSEKQVTVNMWKEWTCDSRIKRSVIGQRLLLFLTKRENGEYEIIHGSTGELFITENNTLETFMKIDFPNLLEFKTGVRMFLEAYYWEVALYANNQDKKIKRLIEQSAIDKMKMENDFFKSMSSWIEPGILND